VKRLLVILFLGSIFSGCSKDDTETIYVETSKFVTEYRIDKVKFIEPGEYWSGDYVKLDIYNEQNQVIYSTVYPQLSFNEEEDIFPIPSDSKFRIMLSSTYGNGIEFLTEANPWEYLVSPTIFKIVVDRNKSFSDKLKVELTGTVITVLK
jgi:hypothetical protein